MAESTKKNIWEELRKPFDPKVVGKIPKGGIQLDYVGHAAVTDRLLSVDPEWSYTFKAIDEYGNPVLDTEGNLWILLTIGGVTRPGVGDGRNMKERIGDALRNAAMRFGVALDLWSKDELESHLDHPENKNVKPTHEDILGGDDMATDKQAQLIKGILFNTHGIKDAAAAKAAFKIFAGAEVAKAHDLTKKQAMQMIDTLKTLQTHEIQGKILEEMEQ